MPLGTKLIYAVHGMRFCFDGSTLRTPDTQESLPVYHLYLLHMTNPEEIESLSMPLQDEKMSMSEDAPPSPLVGARLILAETMTLTMTQLMECT